MFGLNKKLKLASQKPAKSKAKPSDKQAVATSTAASKKKTSIAAIPDLICKVICLFKLFSSDYLIILKLIKELCRGLSSIGMHS